MPFAQVYNREYMEKKKLRVGITQGDINGIGYEVILKTFADPEMVEVCTPVVYGSAKVAAYHRKVLGLNVQFTSISEASEAEEDRLNVLNCTDDEVKVELGVPTREAGAAALGALTRVVEDYENGLIDAIVTAPINKSMIHGDGFEFVGHTEFFANRFGAEDRALMVLTSERLRVAVATNHLPIARVAESITHDLIREKVLAFNRTLKFDFGIDAPRIAVLSLNPHAGDGGLLGTEEKEAIIPAIESLVKEKVLCYGPFPADGFMGAFGYRRFDGVLAMYHDQGLIPFKVLAMDSGVNFTTGLPVVRTSPDHGTAYDIAGKGEADESSFREAVYLAVDICNHRFSEKNIRHNPLRRQYYEKRDDSDKLKLSADTENGQ